jgi:S1-C subfamily serine protease
LTLGLCGGLLVAVIAAIMIATMGRKLPPEQTPAPVAEQSAGQAKDAPADPVPAAPETPAPPQTPAASLPPEPAPPPKPVEYTIEAIVEMCRDGVVLVETNAGIGSGFAISEDGLVATSYHVIKNGIDKELKVHQVSWQGTVRSITTYDKIEVAALDEANDLAILKVADCKVKCLPLGDTASLRTGQKVLTIGNPSPGGEVLCRSVSEGIVSDKDRRIGEASLIQTTTPVNPGNSGGPLLNLRGEVVGVVAAKTKETEGIAFAVPADRLRLLLQNYRQDPPSASLQARNTRSRHKMEWCLELMMDAEQGAKEVVDLYAKVWMDAIKARDDFNDALRDAVAHMDKPRSMLRDANVIIEKYIADLKSHPDELVKCYDCILKAYSAFHELAALAESPEGSYETFVKSKQDLHTSFNQAATEARTRLK